MREVFGAVVVIGIVLVAVFVPVAFFPGTTGRLYQQFSLTIAFATILSVFNAVTLTPALSALLLAHHGEGHKRPRFFSLRQPRHRRRHARLRARARPGAAVEAGHAGAVRRRSVGDVAGVPAVPSAFVPQEDEGYFMTIVQAPSGASLEYTTSIAQKAEKILFEQPEIERRVLGAGLQLHRRRAEQRHDVHAAARTGASAASKEQSLDAVLNRVRGQLFGIPGGMVVAFAPPAIQGLSVFGGFQFEVLDQTGGDINELAAATQALVGQGNQSGRVAGLFSPFRADDPQLVVNIDRDRARSLGLPLREVTDALQVFLGSQYVNDFDFNNRAYRVYVQADQRFRADPSDLRSALRARAERRHGAARHRRAD